MLIIFSENYNLMTKLAESGGLFNKILLCLCLKIGKKWKKTVCRSVLDYRMKISFSLKKEKKKKTGKEILFHLFYLEMYM